MIIVHLPSLVELDLDRNISMKAAWELGLDIYIIDGKIPAHKDFVDRIVKHGKLCNYPPYEVVRTAKHEWEEKTW